MNLTELSNFRYSTKVFDPSKKISDADLAHLKYLIQFTPSSTNLQPWHFIIASSDEGKKRVAKGTEGFFEFNAPKVTDASHVVLFVARKEVAESYLEHVLDTEDKDGRYAEAEHKAMMDGGRKAFLGFHQEWKDEQHWHEKQVYLNMGSLMLGAASLGIDSVPMEGIDIPALNKEFGLDEKGMTAVAVVSLGYRAEADFNAKLPKSRLPQDEIFTLI